MDRYKQKLQHPAIRPHLHRQHLSVRDNRYQQIASLVLQGMNLYHRCNKQQASVLKYHSHLQLQNRANHLCQYLRMHHRLKRC